MLGTMDGRVDLIVDGGTVGGLGAFTTFSAFSLDVIVLYERGQVAFAALYILASVAASIAALLIGLRLARLVLA